jgi:hypothetical protein
VALQCIRLSWLHEMSLQCTTTASDALIVILSTLTVLLTVTMMWVLAYSARLACPSWLSTAPAYRCLALTSNTHMHQSTCNFCCIGAAMGCRYSHGAAPGITHRALDELATDGTEEVSARATQVQGQHLGYDGKGWLPRGELWLTNDPLQIPGCFGGWFSMCTPSDSSKAVHSLHRAACLPVDCCLLL